MTGTDTAAPVIAEVTVPTHPERAFALYVDRPGRTHPRDGLSGAPDSIVYEPFAGGRWYERARDGSEHDWGRVLEWDPPHRLVLAWMVGVRDGAWAHDPHPERASHVELTFVPVGDGHTRVRVVHSGFEAHGAGASSIRNGVHSGWQEDLRDLGESCRMTGGNSPRAVFTGSQVNLFANDVEGVVGFYTRLGFVESYRYAPDGDAWHVEVQGAGLVLGVASPAAARADHGLETSQDGAAMELVLWCEDVDAAYAHALDAGAVPLRDPHDFQDGRLRVGWVADPVGNPIELVQQR